MIFFIISKILAFALKPLLWIVFFLLWGIFRKNKKPLLIALALILFFGNNFIINSILLKWEYPINENQIEFPIETAIVLGGFSSYNEKEDRIEFQAAADRLVQAIRLYQEGKINRILISGGTGSLVDKQLEADYSAAFLKRLQIDSSCIYVENRSKNTYQNLVFSKQLLEENQLEGPYLLITSASHMRRAIAIAKKQNIEVIPFPVDYYSGETKFYFDHLFIPDNDALLKWDILLHEWFGFLAYKFSGYV